MLLLRIRKVVINCRVLLFNVIIQDQKGRISIRDLYETCLQFNLPISCDLLVQLFDYCDKDQDSLIDYVEFSNFLNWKDSMHSGFPKRKIQVPLVTE